MAKITSEKSKLLDNLLLTYDQEVQVLYAIKASWKQLKDLAKDKCAEDFDKALIARETLLEELNELKNNGNKVEDYEIALFNSDQTLIGFSKIARDIYGLDVKVFLAQKSLPPKNKR